MLLENYPNQEEPVIFFDENFKDFCNSFWSRNEAWVWPYLRTYSFDKVAKDLVDHDRAMAQKMRAFLNGAPLVANNIRFDCIVSSKLVANEDDAKKLCDELFKKRFKKNGGCFLEDFMELHSEVLRADVVTGSHLSEIAHVNFVYDLRLQLKRPLPQLTDQDVEQPFIYELHDPSVFRAVEYLLSHPDTVTLNREHHKLKLLPKDEIGRNQFFMDEYFSTCTLHPLRVMLILSAFSSDMELVRKVKLFLDARMACSKKDLWAEHGLYFKNGPQIKKVGDFFCNYLYLDMPESFTSLKSLNNFYEVCSLLERVIKVQRASRDDTVRVFNSGSGTVLKIKTVNSNVLYSKRIKRVPLEKRNADFDEFMETLINVHESLRGLSLFISSVVSRENVYESLKEVLSKIIVDAVTLDPLRYMEHSSKCIRRFAAKVAFGE